MGMVCGQIPGAESPVPYPQDAERDQRPFAQTSRVDNKLFDKEKIRIPTVPSRA